MKGRISTYGLDRTARAAPSYQRYSGAELTAPAVRPGAENHRQYPSLVGNTRRFPDGRVEAVRTHAAEVTSRG